MKIQTKYRPSDVKPEGRMRDHRQYAKLPDKVFKNGEVDGTLNEYKIFSKIRQYQICVRKDMRMLDFHKSDLLGDVLQEIRIDMINHAKCRVNGVVETDYNAGLFKSGDKAVHRCLREYGFYKIAGSRPKRGKELRFRIDKDGNEIEPNDNCICGYGSVMPELCECGMNEKSFSLVNEILDFYEIHSAEETCARFGVKRTRKIEKALMSAMPKQAGAGKGGKRENSGRKRKDSQDGSQE